MFLDTLKEKFKRRQDDKKPIKFNDMFYALNKCFWFSGLDIHVRELTPLQKIYYFFSMVNLTYCHFGEAVFIKLTLKNEMMTKDELMELLELIPCVICTYGSYIKSISLYKNREQLREITEDLRQMWNGLDEDEAKSAIREQYVKATKHLCTFYSIITNVMSMSYVIAVLLSMFVNIAKSGRLTRYDTPYNIWYPYDWKGNLYLYIPTLLQQFHAGLFTTLVIAGFDCLYCVLLNQLALHFKLVGYELTKMVEKYDPADQKAEKRLKEDVKPVVDYHNKIIKYSKTVDSVVRLGVFGNLLTGSLMICLCMFSMNISTPDRYGIYITMLSSTLLQIYMFSYYGNTLIEESTSLSNVPYESNWFDTGKDHCRSIMIIQCRSSKAVAISAMGFFDISIVTFTTILRGAMSYFTLMQSMYKDE